jgi:hypothetical protein
MTFPTAEVPQHQLDLKYAWSGISPSVTLPQIPHALAWDLTCTFTLEEG